MNDLSDRLFNLSINVINSSGANYEESQSGSSKQDFIIKVNIAFKEMRESNYWLRIIKKAKIHSKDETQILIHESEELKKILGKIVSTSRK